MGTDQGHVGTDQGYRGYRSGISWVQVSDTLGTDKAGYRGQ